MTSVERGREGGWPISDERKGGCVDLVLTRGGFQNPENLADMAPNDLTSNKFETLITDKAM